MQKLRNLSRKAAMPILICLVAVFLSGCNPPCCASPNLSPMASTRPFVVEQFVPLEASFESSLNTLLQAASEGRDSDMLSFIAPDITVSYGVESGREVFSAMWRDPDAAEPWGRFIDELQALVAEGAAQLDEGRTLQFPHYSVILRTDVEGDSLARLREGAVVSEARSDSTRTLDIGGSRTVLCEVPVCRGGETDWMMVRVASGAVGYVRNEMLSPAQGQYRAVFEDRGADWILVALIKGD